MAEAAKTIKKVAKKAWKFLWNDNSVWSWLINAALAFIIIKFLVYPGLGLILQTNYPVVAVISDSMQHQAEFDKWWESMGPFYEKHNITKEEFANFRMSTGFNKGDIIILKGMKPKDISIGDVIVFTAGNPEPIIHRVVSKWESEGKYHFATKGDRNTGQRDEETGISQDRILGKGWLKVPYVGHVKIIFTDIIKAIKG